MILQLFEIIAALKEVGAFILEVIVDSLGAWIIAGFVYVIAHLVWPSLSFKWAKAVFKIRGARKLFTSRASMRYPLESDISTLDMDLLKQRLEDTDYFQSLEIIQIKGEKRIEAKLLLDDSIKKYELSPVFNEDEQQSRDLIAEHDARINYTEIGDFVDLTTAARRRIFNALYETGYCPLRIPSITVSMSWDGKEMKIIPWLSQDYEFIGMVEIRGSDIKVYQSKSEAIVLSESSTPDFKDILRNLVVENLSR
ncbi:MAG: hypothetical protein KGY80_13295 [Candidatus Thorarchaeota archaeon]|nr:hypothetical protein [Candidatus Thorarchaeota archaeon]